MRGGGGRLKIIIENKTEVPFKGVGVINVTQKNVPWLGVGIREILKKREQLKLECGQWKLTPKT